MSATRLFLILILAFGFAGCGPTTVPHSDIQLPTLEVAAWTQPVLLLGTPIAIGGGGFLPADLGTQTIRLEVAGHSLVLPSVYESEVLLRWTVGEELIAAIQPGSGEVSGTLTLLRTLTENGRVDSVSIPVVFRVEQNLVPEVVSFTSNDGILYPGDDITVSGNNFLLKGEGHSVLFLDGSFTTQVPPETQSVQAVLPLNALSRNQLQFTLTPDIFGIRPGVFTGSLLVSNETPAGRLDGTGIASFQRELLRPRVDLVEPPVAARGQRIRVVGRGFLPTDPFFEATTLIRLEGEFTLSQTSDVITLDGATALALFPDFFEGNTEMQYILRVTQTPSGELEGLGLLAGDFNGVIRPMIISGPETILGDGAPFTLTVAPQRQIVFVKFLPGFSSTLLEMGLATFEADVKARIQEILNRDYEGINIEFRMQRPDDFIEYSIIEVGGADPNQAGLFGLDNTAGKDVGNLRFNDVIGGTNAETAEQGYYAFGGVFVRSFFQLSPSIPGVEPLPIASHRFDELFGPFMPMLGGVPATADDTLANAPRKVQLDGAVRALGTLVGNTVTHEIGHSLGLSNIEGEFHNIGDNPGWIMDAGNFRPFAERTEIDGQGPAVFSPNNRSYLQRILPIQ